jgi:large subunit ribosomal protein L18Ae
MEMASRHRVRPSAIQIIKTAGVDYHSCKRPATKQFHNEKISFPVTHKLARPTAPQFKTLFKATRPNVAMW